MGVRMITGTCECVLNLRACTNIRNIFNFLNLGIYEGDRLYIPCENQGSRILLQRPYFSHIPADSVSY